MIARQIFYEGRVQGVGFRYSVRQIATGFDVADGCGICRMDGWRCWRRGTGGGERISPGDQG